MNRGLFALPRSRRARKAIDGRLHFRTSEVYCDAAHSSSSALSRSNSSTAWTASCAAISCAVSPLNRE